MSGASAETAKPDRIHIFKDSVGADFDVESVEIKLAPNDGDSIAINNLGIVGGMFETGFATDIDHGFVWFPNNLGARSERNSLAAGSFRSRAHLCARSAS